MDKILITGSGGLVGSEAVWHFSSEKQVLGVDNDSRGRWFGEAGSVESRIAGISQIANYKHFSLDIREKDAVDWLIKFHEPDVIIHCAGQPSHEKSAIIPYEDFQTNTVGTVNLLEAARKFVPKCSFVFTSTNKVYGDLDQIPLIEGKTRYNLPNWLSRGIPEAMPIDQSTHSPFGANKAAADLIVQEYGRYYGMNTVCFRCGCITGKSHQGVEQHGFLSYLCKVAKTNQSYTIFGHQGKQVRDNIHAKDLVDAFQCYLENPSPGAVYNMGGGLDNSCSILEAIDIIEKLIGVKLETQMAEPRKGDHRCYLTNYDLFASRYPTWKLRYSLEDIFQDLLDVS